MSKTTAKTNRPAQFSCQISQETLEVSNRIKKNFGITKKFQLMRGLALLENSLAESQPATPQTPN